MPSEDPNKIKEFVVTRRDIVRSLAATVLFAPLIGSPKSQVLPLLAEDDPDAKDAGYVRDATILNAGRSSEFAGQHCLTCDLYRGGVAAKSGLCKSFPGRRVLPDGWCSQYEGYAG
jgi:High potential iron-sulfur protein